jgi:hypothetical protein
MSLRRADKRCARQRLPFAHHRHAKKEPRTMDSSSSIVIDVAPAHHIRFDYLFDSGRSLAFPCDAQGRVDIDALSERARTNYLYARAMVGREYASPAVQSALLA